MERNTFLYPTFPASILCLWGLLFGITLYSMDYKDLESCDELIEFVVIANNEDDLPSCSMENQLEEELIRFFDSFTLVGNKPNGNTNTHKRNSW